MKYDFLYDNNFDSDKNVLFFKEDLNIIKTNLPTIIIPELQESSVIAIVDKKSEIKEIEMKKKHIPVINVIYKSKYFRIAIESNFLNLVYHNQINILNNCFNDIKRLKDENVFLSNKVQKLNNIFILKIYFKITKIFNYVKRFLIRSILND